MGDRLVVKLQVASVKVLERLLGGDTELEVDLRNSVAQEFAKRHLKAVVASREFDTHMRKFEDVIRQEAQEVLGHKKKGFLVSGSVLNDETKMLVKAQVENEVKRLIRETIDDMGLDGGGFPAFVRKLVRDSVEFHVEKTFKVARTALAQKLAAVVARTHIDVGLITDEEIAKRADQALAK